MRVAVLSDIHANRVALEVVLRTIETLPIEQIWCLGDVVGYGPEPAACVALMRSHADICLAGNHDLALVEKLDLAQFNPIARQAISWQRTQLSDDALNWLQGLSSMHIAPPVTLAHGSPRAPAWEYIANNNTAAENFSFFETALCLVGHTHVAGGWRRRPVGKATGAEPVFCPPGDIVHLDSAYRWILNPGSVGQPRDGDPRAAFAVLDTTSDIWTWHRLSYDIDAVAAAIGRAGLPDVLGQRLCLGW
ncbi:MAG: metallophosphoesterase [Chloroflexi bacterium]|nr:metallophosphoesterase [Chloroflexota bacterium]